jgi:hypothetical protein
MITLLSNTAHTSRHLGEELPIEGYVRHFAWTLVTGHSARPHRAEFHPLLRHVSSDASDVAFGTAKAASASAEQNLDPRWRPGLPATLFSRPSGGVSKAARNNEPMLAALAVKAHLLSAGGPQRRRYLAGHSTGHSEFSLSALRCAWPSWGTDPNSTIRLRGAWSALVSGRNASGTSQARLLAPCAPIAPPGPTRVEVTSRSTRLS